MNRDFNKGCKPQEFCGKVVETRTLTECKNWPEKPYGRDGYLVAKVPVVLSELKIQIDTESIIKLPEVAFDIKFIKKNLYLTQCKLIPETDKLFLKGFVKKNIVYSTPKCVYHDVVSGDVRHLTVKIPFECMTEVKFDIKPEFSIVPAQTEVQIFDPCLMGRDCTEYNFVDFENFSEKVFCELISAKIFETDITEEKDFCCVEPREKKEALCRPFKELKEKMVVFLKLKLLQNQQVNIYGKKHPCKKEKEYDYEHEEKDFFEEDEF